MSRLTRFFMRPARCLFQEGQAEGRRIPISVSTAALRDGKGKVIGGADLSPVEELRKELEGRFQVGDLVIHDALRRGENCRLAAAQELGMHKSTFSRKVEALGISLPEEDGRAYRRKRQ